MRQALCVQYMLLSVTNAKPGDVLEQGALKMRIFILQVFEMVFLG